MIKRRDVWDVCCDECGYEIAIGFTMHADATAEEIAATSEHAGFKQVLCAKCEAAMKKAKG